jgi:hypothetical protein
MWVEDMGLDGRTLPPIGESDKLFGGEDVFLQVTRI